MASIYIQNSKWDKTTIFRQTPDYSGIYGGHKFSSFPGIKYDWALVDGLPDVTSNKIPRSRRIAFIMENPYIWKPSLEFYEGVGIVVSPFDLAFPAHVKWIKHHPAVPWFYGLPFRRDTGLSHCQSGKSRKCLTYFANRHVSEKNGKISIIASNKGVTSGHRWRFKVAEALLGYFGGMIDIFGFGHRPVESKEQAIDNYAFSIAIENMQSDFYMTEKLCDVALGLTTPIYSGASKVAEYFSDVPRVVPYGCDPESFCHHVAKILDEGPDSNITLINRCHEVLYSQNIFAVICSIIKFS